MTPNYTVNQSVDPWHEMFWGFFCLKMQGVGNDISLSPVNQRNTNRFIAA